MALSVERICNELNRKGLLSPADIRKLRLRWLREAGGVCRGPGTSPAVACCFHDKRASRNAWRSGHFAASTLSCRSFFSSRISRSGLVTFRGTVPKRTFRRSRMVSCIFPASIFCSIGDSNMVCCPPKISAKSGRENFSCPSSCDTANKSWHQASRASRNVWRSGHLAASKMSCWSLFSSMISRSGLVTVRGDGAEAILQEHQDGFLDLLRDHLL